MTGHLQIIDPEEHGVILKDNPGSKVKRHSDSTEHREAQLMLTNTRIEAGLNRADKDTRNEKKALYISKLIKLTHFLARNNLSVKELYPKMIEFLSEEMEEPVIKQYLDSAAKNATYTGKDSCDSFLKAMNSYFSDQVNEELQAAAEDIVVFVDEATSNNRKEMMRVSVAYFSEKAKCFKLDFIRLFSVSSTKAEILIKSKKCLLKEILICQRHDSLALMGGYKSLINCY